MKIKLTQGKFAEVSRSDFKSINSYQWHYVGKNEFIGYAARNIYLGKIDGKYKQKRVYMHHQILGEEMKPGFVTDHINGNGIDNRRCNLRVVTQGMNCRNRRKNKTRNSKHVGVSYCYKRNKWVATIRIMKKVLLCKRFDLESDAHKARVDYIKKNKLEGFKI